MSEVLTSPSTFTDFERYGALSSQHILSDDINVKMRAILIDWLFEVVIMFKLLPPTLFTTVHIADAYIARTPDVTRGQLQLIGATSMFLAAKHYEIYAPELADFVYISDNIYTKEQYDEMQNTIFKALGHSVNYPNEMEILRVLSIKNEADTRTHNFTKYLMMTCLIDSKINAFLPTVLVSSCFKMVAKHFSVNFNNAYEIPDKVFKEVTSLIRGLCTRIKRSSLKSWLRLPRKEDKEEFRLFVEGIEKKTSCVKEKYLNEYKCQYFFTLELEDVLVPIKDLKKIVTLGQGTYGKVTKVEYRGKYYARKKAIHFDEVDSIPSSVIREYSILKTLSHNNVLSIEHFTTEMNSVLLPLGDFDLKAYIDNNKYLSETQLKSIASQLFSGLAHVHEMGCIHRDIKPQNVLVFLGEKESPPNFKLADFGSSRGTHIGIQKGNYTHEVCTLWYRSPEILLGSSSYGPELDVWSLLCTLYECDTSTPLFPGDSEIDQLHKIFRVLGTPNEEVWPDVTSLPEYRSEFPQWKRNEIQLHKLCPLYTDLILFGLIMDPDKRPRAETILERIPK